MKIPITLLILMSVLLHSCAARKTENANSFVKVEGTHFVKDGKPYYFIGTNYWYGAMLGMKNGDRERLIKELDELKSLGMVNLRILASSEGGDQDYTVRPATQPTQGQYSEDLLVGLDFVLSEMKKRDMTAILYLTNNWEWSGGLAKYLEWNGYGTVPNPNLSPNTWPQFMSYTAQFHSCKPCREQFLNHVEIMINRSNTINGISYKNDPTIMAWEIANEPRVWNKDNEQNFTSWVNEVTSKMKLLDKNHLVTTGSEGMAGSNDDLATFERTHNNPNIDYLTMHIWPKNWGWYNVKDEQKGLATAIENSTKYINEHITVAKNLKKPLVLEEFGFPRGQESLSKEASVKLRDEYFTAVFNILIASQQQQLPFCAINIWGYGGIGKNNPNDGKWNIGDDYTTDPPQEPQGLNSVFSTDQSTLSLIKKYNEGLKSKE